jgi:hypothetical protein
MKRRGLRRVSDAEADHQDALGLLHREQRNVCERTHVPLRQPRRRGHRVAVGQQSSAAARHFGDFDDFSDTLSYRQHPLVVG